MNNREAFDAVTKVKKLSTWDDLSLGHSEGGVTKVYQQSGDWDSYGSRTGNDVMVFEIKDGECSLGCGGDTFYFRFAAEASSFGSRWDEDSYYDYGDWSGGSYGPATLDVDAFFRSFEIKQVTKTEKVVSYFE